MIDAQKLDFRLYMALASTVYEERFQSPLAQLMIQGRQVNLMVFDPNQEVVTQWIEISSIDRVSRDFALGRRGSGTRDGGGNEGGV